MTSQRVTTKRYEFAEPYAGFWIDLDADPTMGTFEDWTDLKGTDYGKVLASLTIASNVTDREGVALDLSVAESWRHANRGLVEQAYGFVADLFAPFVAKTRRSSTPSATAPATGPTATSPGDTSG